MSFKTLKVEMSLKTVETKCRKDSAKLGFCSLEQLADTSEKK